MTNQEILDFIKQQLKQGIPKEKITADLLASGLSQKDIEKSFKKVSSFFYRFRKWIVGLLGLALVYVFIFYVAPFLLLLIFLSTPPLPPEDAAWVYSSLNSSYTKVNPSYFVPESYEFYQVEITNKFKKIYNTIGSTAEYVDFIVKFYEDDQKQKVLAQFNKEQLGLREMYNPPRIVFLPYSESEYEVVIAPASSPTIYFKVNKNDKSIIIISPNESRYEKLSEENKYDSYRSN